MVSYEFPPLGGGTGNACHQVLAELRHDSGVRVELVTSGAGADSVSEAWSDSIHLHRLPVLKKNVHFWRPSELARWTRLAYRRARDLAADRRFDLCHCWSGWPPGLIGHALRHRMPYVVALRGSDVPGYNRRLRILDPLVFRHVSRRVWRNASAVTAVSEHLKRLARRTERTIAIDVIGNGVDTSFFTPGAPHQGFTILFVGRLVERKGLIFLLRAFRELCARHAGCRLVIAGDGPEKARLESFCSEAGIRDRVSFLGVVATPELRAVYQGASLFVMPAIQEGMSNAVLEAMASGLPVVMTATGGSDAIRGNGAIVKSGDEDSLRTAIARYLENPGLVATEGEISRRLASEMSWRRVAAAYRELYDRVLKRAEA
jgi:glycosyltransferase involved in cell wall biosynthesis